VRRHHNRVADRGRGQALRTEALDNPRQRGEGLGPAQVQQDDGAAAAPANDDRDDVFGCRTTVVDRPPVDRIDIPEDRVAVAE